MTQVDVDFSGLRAIVLGDLMLDTWVEGHVERISPEAPIPVLRIDRRREMLGGAGNVARNIAALGARAILIGIVGEDAAGRRLLEILSGAGTNIDGRVVVAAGTPTTHKTRYLAAGQQILRVDEEIAKPACGKVAGRLIAAYDEALPGAEAIILSDYAKGALTEMVIAHAVKEARRAKKPLIADPKNRNFSRYRGVSLLTPNRFEALAATGIDCADDAGAERAGRSVLEAAEAEAVVVTRGADGLSVVPREGKACHVPSRARAVFDVSGAGDTLVAVLALALASRMPLLEAAHLANAAAGVVVGKPGTATLSPRELKDALDEERAGEISTKIASLEETLERVALWRAEGARIGFTNGCFDLIHPGHVKLLSRARRDCDRLIVALNSDGSVRRLKGADRPIQCEAARATVLASIAAVDLVVLFTEDDPLRLIEAIRPDLLFKGADYAAHEVVGGDLVRSYGGRVCLVPLEAGESTTATISRIARQN
jgi:D-beta-D-heptose 7-phosphate kinase / D-beta-D-heptose 1-phosphate adenosyltransferase